MTDKHAPWDDELDLPGGQAGDEAETEPVAEGEMLFDPTRTGMGPFDPEIDEETWIDAVCDAINEVGARTYLRSMLAQLRETLDDGGVEETRDWLDVLLGHLMGKRVQSTNALPGLPGVMLTFDDGHTLPVVRPPWLRGKAPNYAACSGLFLVVAAIRDDGTHPAWFELVFDRDEMRTNQWHEGEGVRLNTMERSAQAIYCPHDHDGMYGGDVEAVLANLDEHVVGKRVADQVRLPGDVAALVFDDWHVLPVAPVRPEAVNLEAVVGRFLVWVATIEVEAETDTDHINLVFADDSRLRDELRGVADHADQELATFDQVYQAVVGRAGVSVIEATLDSVSALFWANEAELGDWDELGDEEDEED